MNKIVITVEGGLIQDISGIPANCEVEVIDFDTDGSDDDTKLVNGSPAIVSIYKGEADVELVTVRGGLIEVLAGKQGVNNVQ